MSVPVLDSTKKPLMPCSEKRARKMKGRLSLHGFGDGKRLCRNAKKEDCNMLAKQIWSGFFSLKGSGFQFLNGQAKT